jgi:hypothetical protein
VAGGGRWLRQGALWIVALGVTGWLAYSRWKSASAAPVGVDFGYSLAAAREIAAGRSPYLVKQFVYPPPLAFLLAPFAHVQVTAVWKAWVAIIVAAPAVGLAAFMWLIRGPIAWWLRPVAFGVFGLTILYSRYYPMSRDLALGQTDTILFSVLVVAAVAAARPAPRVRGAMIGLAGLVKVWPWSLVGGVVQPGVEGRRRTVLYAAGVALVAILTALVFGWAGLTGFVRNDFTARRQNLVSDSVWSIPRLLFSRTGLAAPIVASPALRFLVTAVVAVWVLGLLLVVLRSRADGALGTWNLLFCVILLLPVSHRQYAMLVLPLLWWWSITSIVEGGRDWRVGAIAGLLALWWLLQTVAWPYNGGLHAITSVRYSVPFFGDLVAFTASVLGARFLAAALPRSTVPQ